MTSDGLLLYRADDSQAAFAEVFDLLLGLHKDGGYAQIDVRKAAEHCLEVMREGMTFVARVNGVSAGTIAMTEIPFWYSQTTYLHDAWFYVKPQFRGGKVGVRLMRAVKDEADKKDKIAFIAINNPDRKPKQTVMTVESQIAGYVPAGHILKIR